MTSYALGSDIHSAPAKASCPCELLAVLARQPRLPSHLAVLELRLGFRSHPCTTHPCGAV